MAEDKASRDVGDDEEALREENIFHIQQEFLRQEIQPEHWREIRGQQSQQLEDFLSQERRAQEERAMRGGIMQLPSGAATGGVSRGVGSNHDVCLLRRSTMSPFGQPSMGAMAGSQILEFHHHVNSNISDKPLYLPSKQKTKRKAADRIDGIAGSFQNFPHGRQSSACPSRGRLHSHIDDEPCSSAFPWSKSTGSSPAPFDGDMLAALEGSSVGPEAPMQSSFVEEPAGRPSRKYARTSRALAQSLPPNLGEEQATAQRSRREPSPRVRATGSGIYPRRHALQSSSLTRSLPPAPHRGIDDPFRRGPSPARPRPQAPMLRGTEDPFQRGPFRARPRLQSEAGASASPASSGRFSPCTGRLRYFPGRDTTVDGGRFSTSSKGATPMQVTEATGTSPRQQSRPSEGLRTPRLPADNDNADAPRAKKRALEAHTGWRSPSHDALDTPLAWTNYNLDAPPGASSAAPASALEFATEGSAVPVAAGPQRRRTQSHNDLLLLEMLNDTVVSPEIPAKPSVGILASLDTENANVWRHAPQDRGACSSPVVDAFMEETNVADALTTDSCALPPPPLVPVGGGQPGEGNDAETLTESVPQSWSPSPLSTYLNSNPFQDEVESLSPLSQTEGEASSAETLPEGMANYLLGTLGCDGEGYDTAAMPPPPPLARMDYNGSKKTSKASNASSDKALEEGSMACKADYNAAPTNPPPDSQPQAPKKAGKRRPGRPKGRKKGDADVCSKGEGLAPNHVVTPSSAAISALSAQVRYRARASEGGGDPSERDRDAQSEPADADVFSIPQYASVMEATQASQQAIHDWDRKFGLRRAHSKTMRESCRSRKEVLEFLKGEGANLVLRRTPVASAGAHAGAERAHASTDDRAGGLAPKELRQSSEVAERPAPSPSKPASRFDGGVDASKEPSSSTKKHRAEAARERRTSTSSTKEHRAEAARDRRNSTSAIDVNGDAEDAERLTQMFRRASLTFASRPWIEEQKPPGRAPEAVLVGMAPPRKEDRKQYHARSA